MYGIRFTDSDGQAWYTEASDDDLAEVIRDRVKSGGIIHELTYHGRRD